MSVFFVIRTNRGTDMTKLLALALLGVGMTSGALALAGYNLAALSWIENAGETNAWGMREMMVLIGGMLFYMWLGGGSARRSKRDETCCLHDGYEADLFDDGGGIGDAGGGSADGGV